MSYNFSHFSHFWRLWSLRLKCSQFQCLVRACFLFHGCLFLWQTHEEAPWGFCYKVINPIHGFINPILVAQLVKNLPAMQETCITSLGWEDPLKKGKAAHSSILAWRIPWTIQFMGSQRVRHD